MLLDRLGHIRIGSEFKMFLEVINGGAVIVFALFIEQTQFEVGGGRLGIGQERVSKAVMAPS